MFKEMDFIYNFVLESGHVVVINGLEVITLGYGFKDYPITCDQYYGTEKVI